MNIFEFLDAESKARGLSFLLIGGHAVVMHGFSRTTADLDLFVRKADKDKWLDLLKEKGFSVLHDGGNFLQFTPPKDMEWPLDLMLVSDETFAGMQQESRETEYRDVKVRIPSLRHLLALKFHALKNGGPHRRLKDFQDVTTLIENNKLNVRDATFKTLVLKYGSNEIYEQLVRMCG